ncbi:MAG: TonB-dependent receptor [Acidobacteria bacterium]|nr:TonB-dependent receptor [Acidobacteriota bacterium]
MKKRCFWQALVVWVGFLGATAMAQVTTGTISGSVQDSTGAVIPGATVTLRNVNTGISRTLSTNAQGRYTAPQLGLGMYEVTAEVSGFQRVVRSGIEMTVGRQAVVDFTLQVGAVTELITVTGEAPLLETTNATLADLVTETQMRELPLNGRSFTDLTAIQPGVLTDLGISQGVFRGGGRIVISGARPQESLYLLDGTEMVRLDSNTPPVSVMNQTLGVDTIREFSLLQNNYGAQYGRAIGGVVNAVTRSGTNEIHGSAFEYLRNEKLDAKNFFDLPDPAPIPPFKRNQFGGAIGGPIVRDSTFFFFSYEGLRQVFSTTDFGSVLTAEARVGQITNCPFVSGSTTVRKRTCTKADATVTEILPLGINPDIKPILDLIPPGNGLYNNDGIQELRGSRKQPGRENYYMFRIDQRLSENDNIFGRMVLDRSSRELPDGQFFDASKDLHPINSEWGSYYFLTMEWTRVISPSVLNIARFGFARNNNNQRQCLEGLRSNCLATHQNIPGLPPQLTIIPGVPFGGPWGVPGVSIPGGHFTGGSAAPGPYLVGPLGFVDNTFSYSDSMRFTKGRHSWDLGVEIRRSQQNQFQGSWSNGQTIWFAPLKNFLTAAQPGYCTGAASDCRGISSLISVASVSAADGLGPPDLYRGWRQTYAAWYVQDDIQLLSNLTLNLGLRWEKVTPAVEVNGKVSQVMDVLKNNFYTQLGKEPMFQLRDILGGFAPRFGFAYSPDQRTSIRGGFGFFREMPLLYVYSLALFAPPWAERLQRTNIRKWPNPLAGADPLLGTRAPTLMEHDFKYPYAMQWNFGIERQVGQSWVARASYIGTRGVNLTGIVNHVQPKLSVDANGVPFTQRLEPSINPFFDNVRTAANIGDAWYNALQLRLQKRFSQGLEFSTSYTWSKNLTSAVGIGLHGGEQGSFGGGFQVTNLWDYKGFDKGPADQNVPHNVNFNFTYEIPIGQGRTFGTNIGSIADAVLGGWQINGVFTKRSGLPKDIGGPGYSTNQFCRCTVRPNLKPGGNNNPVIGKLDHWFDETQFLPVPQGYFGNLGKNTLIGPGLTKVDFSVFKAFRVGEGKNLQFRAEFFNFPNHPTFKTPAATVFETNGQFNPNPGRVTTTVGTSRQIQLALKFEF